MFPQRNIYAVFMTRVTSKVVEEALLRINKSDIEVSKLFEVGHFPIQKSPQKVLQFFRILNFVVV